MDRRKFLAALPATLAATGFAAEAAAAHAEPEGRLFPRALVEKAATGPSIRDVWRLELPPGAHRDPDDPKHWRVVGGTVRAYWRGLLFHEVTLPNFVWIDVAFNNTVAKLLATPYTPTYVYYLYLSDCTLNQLLQTLVQPGALKHPRAWRFDDQVAFRGDPIGSILHDLCRRT